LKDRVVYSAIKKDLRNYMAGIRTEFQATVKEEFSCLYLLDKLDRIDGWEFNPNE
jgi:hypothetical protein